MNWLPIRKVAVGFLASVVVYAARHVLGLDLGPDAVADALDPVVGLLAAYLVRDPRVRDAVDRLDHSALAGELEGYVLDALERDKR